MARGPENDVSTVTDGTKPPQRIVNNVFFHSRDGPSKAIISP